MAEIGSIKKSVVIDGVEYLTIPQLCERTGYSRDGIIYKVNKIGLKPMVLPNRRRLYKLDDVIEAERHGKFIKYL